MPRSKVDPDRPSECSPKRILCVGFWAVETIAICTWTVFTVTPNYGVVSRFRKCGLPCGLCRSLCTLQLSCSAFASVTTATLGMNGWLGLIHQGLSPWKKRQASLGAPTELLRHVLSRGKPEPRCTNIAGQRHYFSPNSLKSIKGSKRHPNNQDTHVIIILTLVLHATHVVADDKPHRKVHDPATASRR